MTPLAELLLVFVMLTNLSIVGSSRIAACIQRAAAQGMALAFLPLVLADHALTPRLVVIAGVTFLVKGLMLPRLLLRALRTAEARHEVESVVGFAVSVLISLAIVGLSFWAASRFPARPLATHLVLPVALSAILIGLLIIISRRNALNQVVGYLVMENGVYIFGVALALQVPFLVELSVLLDVFVAVFAMGIATFHISREFDHIDADRLQALRD